MSADPGCSYAPVYVVVEQANTPDAKTALVTPCLEKALRRFAASAKRSDVALSVSTGLKFECLLRFEAQRLSLSDSLASPQEASL